MSRTATVERKTSETDIKCTLNLDGSGKADISTGIGFFDHMLDAFARHGNFDLELKAVGDLHVDTHHTIEDTGIVLGNAIKEALGSKEGITRYGFFLLPMDEVLAQCALDLSGRPYFVYDAKFNADKMGDMDTEMVREFFYAISYSAAMNLNLKILDAGNAHHMSEAMFKAFARALCMACAIDPAVKGVPSTKGTI
ncbi:MAG: imidazoleglycerol-phosphate dehydratase HisB [Eubacterium sp.]|nr:imidazoleglycerol-phosphate dehydratase HisB [Eubacterium sp.]